MSEPLFDASVYDVTSAAGFFSKLSELAGGSLQTAVGFALGFAASNALSPLGTDLEQKAWAAFTIKAPDAETMAEGVAQGQVDPGTAASWAAEQGYGPDAFAALVNVANTGPALGLAYSAWRRGELTDEQFTTAMTRQAIETQWFPALQALKDNLLDPAEIAKAIHRGIMVADGLLVTEPPTTPGKVPMVPQSSIDSVTEAAGSGIDTERLRIMVGNAGLPPGIVQMLELYNRGEITEDDFQRGVGESNLRNEWGPAIFALARRLLTPTEYQEAALRGVITTDQANAGAGLSGMETSDAQLLFQTMGRPVNVHQITTGLARGGTYGGDYSDVPEPYQDAIRRSSTRPEYASLAYANRYTLPGYFVIKAMLANGTLTADDATTLFEQEGWPPDLASKAAVALSPSGAGGADPNVVKAQTQLWTTTHTSYVNHWITDTDATAALKTAGVASSATGQVLAVWQAERALIHAGLTAAQIKKAVGSPGHDAAWATGRLQELGWDTDDAATFLAE